MRSDTLATIANRLLLSVPTTAALALLELPWGQLPHIILQGAVTGLLFTTLIVGGMLAAGRRFRFTPRDLAIGLSSGVVFLGLTVTPLAFFTAMMFAVLWFVLRVVASMLSIREARADAY